MHDPAHAFMLETVQRQRSKQTTGRTQVPDVFIAGMAFPQLQHRAVRTLYLLDEAGSDQQRPMIVLERRADIKTCAASCATFVTHNRPNALVQHID